MHRFKKEAKKKYLKAALIVSKSTKNTFCSVNFCQVKLPSENKEKEKNKNMK